MGEDLEEEEEGVPVRTHTHEGLGSDSGEESEDDRAGLIAHGAAAAGPSDYPEHPADDDLACVPELPCGSYT